MITAEAKPAETNPVRQTPRAAPAIKARESDVMMTTDHHRYARIQLMVKQGVTIKDIMEPEFWSQVAYKFQSPLFERKDYTGSIIEVRSEDHSLYAELYVRAVQKNSLVVSLLKSDQDGIAWVGVQKKLDDTSPFEVRWNVGKRGYDVLRKSDKQIVGEAARLKTKEQAFAWIDEMKVA